MAIEVHPTLVVGVGGTGCTIAKRLKRAMLDQIDARDRSLLSMRFVGIDTTSMAADASRAEAELDFGIQLGGRSYMPDPDSEPGRSFANWLPTDGKGKLPINPAELASGRGAGGKRLLGRFAFKYGAPEQFEGLRQQVVELNSLVNNPLKEWNGVEYKFVPGIEVIVIASIAGGTGSGGFLDAIALCHKACDETSPGLKRYFRGFFITPEAFLSVAAKSNLPLQQATAYACLKDLNHVLHHTAPKFHFHGYNDVELKDDLFLNETYLVGMSGSVGSLPNVDELMNFVSSSLFGIIGTPMGVTHGNRQINSGDDDLFCSFGLIGVDYDWPKIRHAAANRLGALALHPLLYGEGHLSEAEIEKQAAVLVDSFVDGPDAKFVKDLAALYTTNVAFVREDEALRRTKPKTLASEVATHAAGINSESILKDMKKRAATEWDPRGGEAGDRKSIVDAVTHLTSYYGLANAASIVILAANRVAESAAQFNTAPMLDFGAPASLAGSLRSEMDSMGWREVIFNKDATGERMVAALDVFNEGVSDHVGSLAVSAARETVFDPGGLPALLNEQKSILVERREAFLSASRILEEEAKGGSTLALQRNTLDLTGVIYDMEVPPEHLPLVDEAMGNDASRALLADLSVSSLTVALMQEQARDKATLSSKIVGRAFEAAAAIIDKLRRPHILDVLGGAQDGGEEERIKTALDQVVAKLTNLASLDVGRVGVDVFQFAIAVVPDMDREGHTHRHFDLFERTFRSVCTTRKIQQASVEPWPGATNRLFANHWVTGFALNDRDFRALPKMRNAYRDLIRDKPFLEVDREWRNAVGPGMESHFGRKTVWTLALAYGLISSTNETGYYVNMKSKRIPGVDPKDQFNAYEVDLDAIAKAVDDPSKVEGWFSALCIAPSNQKVGKKRLPLAYELGGLKALADGGKREARDRIGTGRETAMNAFLNNANEDYADVEEGIKTILNAYFEARGVAATLELEKYREALADSRPSEATQAQIAAEVAMLDDILQFLKDQKRLPFEAN